MELLGKLKRHWPLQKGTEKMTFNGRRGVFWPWCDSSHIHCSREPREGKLPSPPDKKVHLIKKSLPDKKMLSALQKCKGAKYIHRPPQKWPSLCQKFIEVKEKIKINCSHFRLYMEKPCRIRCQCRLRAFDLRRSVKVKAQRCQPLPGPTSENTNTTAQKYKRKTQITWSKTTPPKSLQ